MDPVRHGRSRVLLRFCRRFSLRVGDGEKGRAIQDHDQTGRRVSVGDVDIDEIALGFWFPGGLCYIGETYAALTEHQHLTVYIGYIVRLADSVSRRRVDLRTLRNGLGTELLWEHELISGIARAAVRQAGEADAPTPGWPDSVKVVYESLVAPRIAK